MFAWLKRLLGYAHLEPTRIADLKAAQHCCIEGEAIPLAGSFRGLISGAKVITSTILQERLMDLEHDGLGRSRNTWHLVNDVDFGQQFFVKDETGMVRIDRMGWSTLRAPKQRIAGRSEYRTANLETFRAAMRGHLGLELLEQYDLEGFDREVRISELSVPEGARVRVQGVVRVTGEMLPGGAGAGFRDVPRLLELVPPDEDKMIIEYLHT